MSLLSLGGGNMIASYVRNGRFYSRRTSDDGLTWLPAIRRPIGFLIAGRGPTVDMTWAQDGLVMFAQSVDYGDTFGPPVAISRSDSYAFPWPVGLAHSDDDIAYVLWSAPMVGALKLSSSRDGFERAIPITDSGSSPGSTFGGPGVVLGGGVMYVPYYTAGRLVVVTSTDAGDSWSSPVAFSEVASDACGTALEAADDWAYLVTSPSVGTLYGYQTLDGGQTWSRPSGLTSQPAFSCAPALAESDGTLRLVYTEFAQYPADIGQTVYRESHDGIDWSREELLPLPVDAPSEHSSAHAADVDLADSVLVLFTVKAADGDGISSVYVQRARP